MALKGLENDASEAPPRRAGGLGVAVHELEGWSTSEKGVRVRLGFKRWMAPEKCRRPIVTESFRKIEGRVVETKKKLAKAGTVLQDERLELVAFTQA